MVALIGLTLVAGRGVVAAQDQDGTPAAGASGVVTESLGKGVSAVAPDRVLILQERTFAPGVDSGAHPAPGPAVLSVEKGTIVFAVVEGAAVVTRYEATTQETIGAGSEATLQPGDSVFYDQGVVHDVRNDGTEPATTLEARFNPNDMATVAPIS
jgi:mannose-6-phosphate isomerase-like protein (cupin superfamily)